MLQFTFNRKLDPDGSNLHKLLEAQITYEETSAFRSLYFHLLAILAVPIWLEVLWPDYFGHSTLHPHAVGRSPRSRLLGGYSRIPVAPHVEAPSFSEP
jgi:hypothetical protein